MHGSSERKESGNVVFVENEAEGVSVRKETGKPLCTLSYLENCAECKQHFHNREPMLLPCLHSLCKTCVPLPWRSLAIRDQPGSSPAADQGSKPLNVLRCPVCRQECMDVDVMENFFVRDSVEIPSSTVDKPIQLCMSCEDKTVVSGFCEECVEFLCVTCIDAHQRVKFTKDHHIRQQEELSQILNISTPKPVFCNIHKQEPLKLFCETCDRPTCRDCQLLKHKDHNYQFLEDAYKYHRMNMEDMVCQLQEKRRGIEEISNLINNGLAQADENYKTVQNEIKSSMCSLISEINKKGKMLLNQLENLTKDHHNCLRKQQQDVNSLSRHLDHVMTFTKWATGCNGGTALLQCKRLILFQIRNLLGTKCSTAFVPQNIVHFQCKSGYWASNVEIGSLVVENIPGPQMNGFQGLCPVNHLGQGSPAGLPPGPSQQPLPSPSTLAQLQIQVERLAQQQPPPLAPPPHWSWCQSVPLPRAPSIRPQRSPEMLQGFHPVPQQSRGFMPPHYHQFRPSGAMNSPGSPSQALQNLKGLVISPGCPPQHMDALQTRSTLLYSHNAPLTSSGQLSSPLSLQQSNLAFSSPLQRPFHLQTTFIPGSGAPVSQNNCQSPCAHPDTETKVPVGTQAFSSAAKRRRQSSPGPIIVIKDEPEEMDRMRYCSVGSSLPDSTGDQGPTLQDGLHKDGSHHSTGVQTVVSQHRTTDRPVAQHRTKEEASQVPQQGQNDQSRVPFQNTEKQTLTSLKGTRGQYGADDQTTEESNSSGHLPSSDAYSNDETQSPQQSTEGQSKGHDQSAKNPEPTQPPSVKYVAVNKAEALQGPSKDQCGVCQTGGELPLCCDKCSRVYHCSCHIPHLLQPHCGQWFCSLCRDLYKPEMEYDSEILTETTMKSEVSVMLKPVDKRKCQKLLLQIHCSELSEDLRTLLAHTKNQQCDSNKTPVQLAEIKSKLESQQSLRYCSPVEFVSDVRIVLRNRANVCETDSDVKATAANLEKFFEEQLKSMFPEMTFP